MTASDAIVVGEDWISEHYFTTDATKESFQARVLARRKEWDAQKDDGDPAHAGSPPPASSLLDRFADPRRTTTTDVEPTVRALNADARATILGYDGSAWTRRARRAR